MRILAIETSCDETSVAVLECDEGNFILHKNIVASQAEIHSQYGGVVPEVAARRHIDIIFPILLDAGISRSGKKIDIVAVTIGPGLAPALRIGVSVASTLSYVWKKPLVGVNHLEGHIYSAYLRGLEDLKSKTNNIPIRDIQFPCICLLVSGGHTELLLMKDHGDYDLIGMTRDDAAGEAFDKVAYMLGFSYPGGPIISELAQSGDKDSIQFPRPMIDSGDFDMSFSGLKTAVMVYLRKNGIKDNQHKADISASFQEAVIDVLVEKSLQAIRKHAPKSFILTGGVSANTRLRTDLAYRIKKEHPDVKTNFSPIAYSGDNAAMIAVAAYFRAKNNEFIEPLSTEARPNMRLA